MVNPQKIRALAQYFSVGFILSIVVIGGLFYEHLSSLYAFMAAEARQNADASAEVHLFERVGILTSIDRDARVVVIEFRDIYNPPGVQTARVHIADSTIIEQSSVLSRNGTVYGIRERAPSSLARLQIGEPIRFAVRARDDGMLEAIRIQHGNGALL